MVEIKYSVIRDSREKLGKGWIFEKGDECMGTEVSKLDSGDYSLKGYEKIITIERKGSSGELSINIFEKRFEEELKRMEEFIYPFMIFEFEYRDVCLFPINSGIPKRYWHKLKMTHDIMEKTISRYMIKYKTKIIFAGPNGQKAAKDIFHSFMKYGKKS